MKLPLTTASGAVSRLGSCRRTTPANDPDHEVPLMSPSRRSPSRHAASGQHRAERGPRLRFAVTGAAAVAVLGSGTAFACLGIPHAAPAASATAKALDHL